jgi:hypothetical protein
MPWPPGWLGTGAGLVQAVAAIARMLTKSGIAMLLKDFIVILYLPPYSCLLISNNEKPPDMDMRRLLLPVLNCG